MFGLLEPQQIERIKAIVVGKNVWALGSGPDTQEAWSLLEFGADRVYAVDKAQRSSMREPRFSKLYTGGNNWRICDCQSYFTEFVKYAKDENLDEPDVVFVKWPQTNHQAGLVQLIARATVVVYIGVNDGATACGPKDMWSHFRARSLLEVVQGKHNDMMVYGDPCEPAAEPRCREEVNAVGWL